METRFCFLGIETLSEQLSLNSRNRRTNSVRHHCKALSFSDLKKTGRPEYLSYFKLLTKTFGAPKAYHTDIVYAI